MPPCRWSASIFSRAWRQVVKRRRLVSFERATSCVFRISAFHAEPRGPRRTAHLLLSVTGPRRTARLLLSVTGARRRLGGQRHRRCEILRVSARKRKTTCSFVDAGVGRHCRPFSPRSLLLPQRLRRLHTCRTTSRNPACDHRDGKEQRGNRRIRRRVRRLDRHEHACLFHHTGEAKRPQLAN